MLLKFTKKSVLFSDPKSKHYNEKVLKFISPLYPKYSISGILKYFSSSFELFEIIKIYI
jgi:hypothetical protein